MIKGDVNNSNIKTKNTFIWDFSKHFYIAYESEKISHWELKISGTKW